MITFKERSVFYIVVLKVDDVVNSLDTNNPQLGHKQSNTQPHVIVDSPQQETT